MARPEEVMPHQDKVEQVIDAHLVELGSATPIANPAAPSAGYVQAEATAVRNAVVSILDILRGAGLLAEA